MTNRLPQRVRYYGQDEPLPATRLLHAGPLSAVYDNGDLRYIRLGEHEIVRRVYAAIRDRNWGTVRPELSNVTIETGPDSFTISYDVTNRQSEIDFFWQGRLTGTADGTIVFEFEGEARSTFQRNRIGFCVLHPMDLAGTACTVRHVDGTLTESTFPELIAPHQPFFDMWAITHTVRPGVQAEVLMEGDSFEMEDQRNWTDASFKTYCTPLSLPFPATVEAGTRIRQRITIRLLGDVPAAPANPEPIALTYTLGDEAQPLPALGLEVASHGEPLTASEIARLTALHLDHLRVEVRLFQPDAEARLQQAAEQAAALGAGLEIALWVSDAAEAELAAFRQLLDHVQPPVVRWLVFHKDEISTTARWLTLARAALGDYAPDAPLGSGTNAFFTELNRNRPPVEALDLVCYSVNPQVHAFANADLVETLAAQAATVTSARAFSGGHPVAVSPITFFMRFNPNATGAEAPTPPSELPRRVDPRQLSLFGAGWTAGSLKYLAESGAASLTYYETTGWLGVMERAAGAPLPDKFQSIPGGVYPLYHILAAAGEFAGGEVVLSRANEPLVVNGLTLRQGDRTRVLLANFSADPQQVTVIGLTGSVRIKRLDEHTIEAAMTDPEAFRAAPSDPASANPEGLLVDLPPFAVVQIDA